MPSSLPLYLTAATALDPGARAADGHGCIGVGEMLHTSGAGDVFVGGFPTVLVRAQRWSSLRWCTSSNLRALGTQSSIRASRLMLQELGATVYMSGYGAFGAFDLQVLTAFSRVRG